MGKFSKVFDIGEEQLLVMLVTDDDELAKVSCTTEMGGFRMSIDSSFSPGDGGMDKAWEDAENFFGAFDQAQAEKFRAMMEKSFNELMPE